MVMLSNYLQTISMYKYLKLIVTRCGDEARSPGVARAHSGYCFCSKRADTVECFVSDRETLNAN